MTIKIWTHPKHNVPSFLLSEVVSICELNEDVGGEYFTVILRGRVEPIAVALSYDEVQKDLEKDQSVTGQDIVDYAKSEIDIMRCDLETAWVKFQESV